MIDRSSPEPRYPVRVVTSRTGLTADALRAWERRYGAVRPSRSAGRQRLYSEDDVARLMLLRRVTEAGHSISEVAGLELSALEALLEPLARDHSAVTSAAVDTVVADALDAAIRLDGAAVESVLRRGALALGGTTLVDRIVPNLMREVGDGWYAGTLHPAHEHVASASVRRVLDWSSAAYAAVPRAGRIVVATPEEELHELGASLAAAMAAEAGWGVVYLGPSLPVADVLRAAEADDVRAVALSAVYDGDGATVDRLLAVARHMPPQIPLFVGGAVTVTRSGVLEAEGVRVLPDMPALRAALHTLRAAAPNGRYDTRG